MAVSQLQARSILSLSKADIAMQLFREQFTDASILSDFTCGLQVMDDFIHHNLQSYLDAYSCSAYCLYSEEGEIVAFFVIRHDTLAVFDDDAYDDHKIIYDSALPPTIPVNEYPSVEIEYLAVAKDYQRQGIGSLCIEQIIDLADEVSQLLRVELITVDAFKSEAYSAIPFYEKCNFSALEYPDPNKDTLRMYRPIWIVNSEEEE